MIVDLIDGDDFRSRLCELGLALDADDDPRTCAELAATRYAHGELPGLPALVKTLLAHRKVMLPEVREAIETILLPALGQG